MITNLVEPKPRLRAGHSRRTQRHTMDVRWIIGAFAIVIVVTIAGLIVGWR
jgi:hypothetical protein